MEVSNREQVIAEYESYTNWDCGLEEILEEFMDLTKKVEHQTLEEAQQTLKKALTDEWNPCSEVEFWYIEPFTLRFVSASHEVYIEEEGIEPTLEWLAKCYNNGALRRQLVFF